MLCLQHFRTWILQNQLVSLLGPPQLSQGQASLFPRAGSPPRGPRMHWNIGVSRQRCEPRFQPTDQAHIRWWKTRYPLGACDPQLCVQTSASQIWGSWESEDVSSDSVGLEEDLKHCLPNKLPGAIASPRTAQWGARWSDLEGPLRASFSVLFKLGSWELLMMYFEGMIWKTRRKPRTPLYPRINQYESASL